MKNKKSLLNALQTYLIKPWCTAEEMPKIKRFIEFVNQEERCFDRVPGGHVTASVWIVNAEYTHALLTHHKKFNCWLQLGGHADNDANLPHVAQKEAWEESGINGLQFLESTIFDVDIHEIPKPCAYHYDVRYLLQAPLQAQFTVSDESHDLAWVSLHKINEFTSERSVLRMAEKCHRFLNKSFKKFHVP